jgi:universal bacterial protein yeaZ
MLIFSITTTTKIASVSLHDGRKMLGEIGIEVAKTHSVGILDQIDRLLEWTGKKLENIDTVLVSIGPGSFTGVRIAISVVKGLFYGKNINIYEVNELDALAYQAYYTIGNICGYNSIRYSIDNETESFNIINSDMRNIRRNIKIYSMIDSGKEKIYYSVYELVYKGKNLDSSQLYNINRTEDYKADKSDNLEKIEDYKVDKLDSIIEDIIENTVKDRFSNEDWNDEIQDRGEKLIYFIGDGAFNYKDKIIRKLENIEKENFGIENFKDIKIRFLEDRNMKINSLTFAEMFLNGKLKNTDIFSLKPDYLEKSQAERDKKERGK